MKKRESFHFPSATVILLFVILLMTLLTYIIPGGEFLPSVDPQTGESLISLDSYVPKPSTPVSFLSIPIRIVNTFVSGPTLSITSTYLFMGGSIYIITGCGAFQALAVFLMRKLKGNRLIMVAGFTSLFAICNLVLSPHSFVAFVPFGILFARELGYDSMVGVAMPLLGGAVSFSTGALLATTMTAQTMVGLPIYSGAVYRIVSMVLLLIPTIIYIYRYGEKVRLNKIASLSPEQAPLEHQPLPDHFEFRHLITLAAFFGTMIVIIYGTQCFGWSNLQLCAAFMVLGFGIGLLFGNGIDETIRMYIKGAQSMIPSAVLAGLAGTAAAVLSDGNVIATVVFHATNLILKVPAFLYAPVMFTMHLLINCVIVSGGGQAAATMPIMGPIANFCGMPMQTAVFCFNLGDGLGNYILPHSNQLVSYLEAGKINYIRWTNFIGKLFLIWIVIAWCLTGISVYIWA